MSLPVLNGPPFVPVKVKETRGVVDDVLVISDHVTIWQSPSQLKVKLDRFFPSRTTIPID